MEFSVSPILKGAVQTSLQRSALATKPHFEAWSRCARRGSETRKFTQRREPSRTIEQTVASRALHVARVNQEMESLREIDKYVLCPAPTEATDERPVPHVYGH